MGRVVYFLPHLNTISELVEYIESREKIHPTLDPLVPDELASPLHKHHEDRCSNCEKVNKIIATLIVDERTELIRRDCFILYRK